VVAVAMTDLALAVDIGGTKMAVALVDRSGTIRQRAQVPTPPTSGPGEKDAETLWQTLVDLVQHVVDGTEGAASEASIVVCGVGCGGPMSPEGETVSPLNIGGWREFALRARLRELSGVPTFVDNDAKALALAEGSMGAAAGEHNFIGMVVSTGIGGGIVLNGRLLGGRLGNAGHIGHVVVEPEGRRCVCGGRGCLEAEASGSSLAEITGQPAELAPPDVIERTGTLVGRAVASVVNLLDLPLAVVSGSVALGFGDPFFAAAQQEVELRCGLDFARGAKVVPGGLGDRGPLIGASCVGWRGLDGPL
jgi:glucokinase